MNLTLILMTLVHYDLLVVYEERVLGTISMCRDEGEALNCFFGRARQLPGKTIADNRSFTPKKTPKSAPLPPISPLV
jgi:hypothetical protein